MRVRAPLARRQAYAGEPKALTYGVGLALVRAALRTLGALAPPLATAVTRVRTPRPCPATLPPPAASSAQGPARHNEQRFAAAEEQYEAALEQARKHSEMLKDQLTRQEEMHAAQQKELVLKLEVAQAERREMKVCPIQCDRILLTDMTGRRS